MPSTVFSPNQDHSYKTIYTMIALQVFMMLVVWQSMPRAIFPSFGEIFTAWGDLWADGIVFNIIKSLWLNIESLTLATIISLSIAYLTVTEFFRPIAAAIGKLRFLSSAGLLYVFTMFATSNQELKVSLLTFSITVFLVTSMVDVVASVSKEQYDLARTLQMGPWRQVWEVVILGQADKAFVCIRQNAAIGWMMIVMVEGMVHSEGGVGPLLLDQDKHFRLSTIFALQFVMFFLGFAQDYGLGVLRGWFCPYADLGMEKR
jgi:NitT/TauT family transport system permease protein